MGAHPLAAALHAGRLAAQETGDLGLAVALAQELQDDLVGRVTHERAAAIEQSIGVDSGQGDGLRVHALPLPVPFQIQRETRWVSLALKLTRMAIDTQC
jgi:hypothetical protein